MLTTAQEFRRKVLIARFAVLAGVLLILAVFAWLKWSETEAGIVSNLSAKLKGNDSRNAALEGLDLAERFKSLGQKTTAAKIEAAVIESLKSRPGGDSTKTYVELSSDLEKRGDKYFAGRFAVSAFACLNEKAGKEKNFKPSDSELADLEQAASTILRLKSELSDEERNLVLSAAYSLRDLIEKNGSENLLPLALDSVSKTQVSSEGITLMFVNNRLFARQEKIGELDKAINRCAATLEQVGRKASLAKAPEPFLAGNLIDLAEILKSNHASMAAKYLGMADELLRQNDPLRLSESERQVLAASLCRMSEIYLAISEEQESLACARAAALLAPLADAESGRISNQLLEALASSGKYSEAEPIASSSYKFFKAKSANNPEMQSLRSNCARAYFKILGGLGKTASALTLINDEIREQRKLLPNSAQELVELNGKLADYYLARHELKYAANAARQIAGLVKFLNDEKRLDADMLLISYGAKTKTAQLALDASMDTLAFIKKQGGKIKQSWLDGLCMALDSLKKLDADSTYDEVLAEVKNGFSQQLSAPDADPLSLSAVVNTLGIGGEEKIADSLRAEAMERLPDAKKAAFAANSMDFVVSGEKETSEYTDPGQAVAVYLELARSMRGKDDEQAFKNAYEALKIAQLLAMKWPEKRAELFDSVDEASGIMIKCKTSADKNQLLVLDRISGLFLDQAKISGKIAIIDLVLASEAKNNIEPGAETLSLVLSKAEILARRGQAQLLDAHLAKSRSLVDKLMGSGANLCSFYLNLADMLCTYHDNAAARRYYKLAKSTLETMELRSRQAENEILQAQKLKATKPVGDKESPDGAGKNQGAAVSGQSGQGGDEQKLRALRLNRQTALKLWTALANGFRRAADSESAIVCLRRAVALKPMNDLAGANLSVQLLDRLVETGNNQEAETLAMQIYNFLKQQAPSPQVASLRSGVIYRYFRIEKALQKENEALEFLKNEIQAGNNTNAGPLASALLQAELAAHYLQSGEAAAAGESLKQILQLRAALSSEEKSAWLDSGLPKELLWSALIVNYPKLASDSVQDLVSDKGLNKAEALRKPEKWWSSALVYFRRNGDAASYKALLSFVKEAYKQELAGKNADFALLASVLNELTPLHEEKSALAMRADAVARLPESERESFLSKISGLPEYKKENAGSGKSAAGEEKNENKSEAASAENDGEKAGELGESDESDSSGATEVDKSNDKDKESVPASKSSSKSGGEIESRPERPKASSKSERESPARTNINRGRLDTDD